MASTEPQDGVHLFLYGALLTGDGAQSLLAGCERVGTGSVHGTLYDLGDFPALLLAGADGVRGEIWRCPPARILAIDRERAVEEGAFRRVGVDVEGTGCWTYVAGPALGARLGRAARIRSGEWHGRATPRDGAEIEQRCGGLRGSTSPAAVDGPKRKEGGV